MGTPLNPPNFASASNDYKPGAYGKVAGSAVRVGPDAEATYEPGEVKAIFFENAPVAGTAGSASMHGGATLALGSLAQDTMYEFPVTYISCSSAEAIVFKH